MPKITRKLQKIFGGGSTDNGQFGSARAGTFVTSTDPDVLQALTAFVNGWADGTLSGQNLPTLEEMQGLQFLFSRQIAYLLQEGIAEYNSGTSYYINSIVKETGTLKLYASLTDDNVGNALSDGTKWKQLIDLNALPASFGTMASQNANSVAITGGTISGITDLAIADGGTGASSAAAARDNLGVPSAIAAATGSSVFGLTMSNNVTDVVNDIDFATGAATSDDLTTLMAFGSTFTKRLDATFSAGTNQGMLDTGAKANNTWYHLFAISEPNGLNPDYVASLSPTTPTATLLGGRTKKRRIGAIRTDGSGNIRLFVQRGNTFLWTTTIQDVSSSTTTSATLSTLTVPSGVSVEAILTVSQLQLTGGAGSCNTLLSHPESTDTGPVNSFFNVGGIATSLQTASGGQLRIFTNTSSQVRRISSVATATIYINTYGWVDPRI